jgi:penicillin-binding protein 1C
MSRLKDKMKRTGKRAGITLLALVVLFFLMDLVFPVKADISYAPVITARDGSVMHTFLTADQQWRMQARLDEITPELEKAIVFKEDKHFYKHFGVNPLAVGRAAFNNLFRLKRTSGASTITMQVARMLQPKRRSYINKVVEMFRAMQLELHYSKREILQLYLNLVPYGSNIQGVKAASILYFDKTPDQLSLAEITALSIIPNRPNSLVIGKDNSKIVVERNKWLTRFEDAKLFDDDIIKDAMTEPLTAYRHEAPKHAPQLAVRLRNSYPGQMEIRATVDAGVQRNAEEIVANYVNMLKLQDIHNASVIVIDNATNEVRAYVGSSDFNDRAHHGQVDGVKALRSPGSTLKPILYGLAFDKGMATPKTMIADVPINIKGYSPENYDLSFRGNVSIEDALRLSLNIPAVKTLDNVGTAAFVHILSEAGFTSVWQKRKKVGLSMILGGCGVKLEELTALYASFANSGNYYPSQLIVPDSIWLKNKHKVAVNKKGKAVKILSDESAYMVTNILTELHRPDLPNLSSQAQGIPRIAWKTGTSYGRKDAWSIGYNKRYTIGVWCGNFSGQGVVGLNGAGTATPLLFQLFHAIDRRASQAEWLQQPESVAFRLVCSKTGKLPADYCTEQVMDLYIPGISNNGTCEHLKEVYISADENMSYCTSCCPTNGYKLKQYDNVLPELAAYYESAHIPYAKIPAHNAACSRLFDGQSPVINSLTNGLTYIITDKEQQQLQLSCTVSNDVQKIYWYINDQFYTVCNASEKTFFIPRSPNVKISCTDDKGRVANIEVKVKFI